MLATVTGCRVGAVAFLLASVLQSHNSPTESSVNQPSSDPLSGHDGLADGILWSALRVGNLQALGVLYRRYAGLVYSIGLKVLGDAQAAEDLTQDIFLKLIEQGGYDPARGSLRTYLAILTRSRALDRLRSKSAASRGIDRLRRLHRITSSAVDIEKITTSAQINAVQTGLLHAALQQLSAEERQVLTMIYFEGLSQSEVSHQLALPLGTVKTRSRRALIKLRKAMKPLPSGGSHE